jgi:hypothetical protein
MAFVMLTKSLCRQTIPVNIDGIDSVERKTITLPNNGGSKTVTRLQMRSGDYLDVMESVTYIAQYLPMAEQLRAMPMPVKATA